MQEGAYMKINTFYPGVDGSQKKNRQDGVSDKTSALDFADLLNQAARVEDGVDASAPVTDSVSMIETGGLTPAQSNALSMGETTLDLIEHLGDMLKENESGQGSMDSLAEALKGQVGMLLDGRDNLDVSDPLRKTINEIGILAAVQGSRISRGEYSE